jgi:FixJ family two-component response regulator
MKADDLSDAVVFIVDQDHALRTDATQALASTGVVIETFDQAEDLLVRHRQVAGPRCLLLDLGIQGMSALSLEDELRRRADTIPIIVVTGLADVPKAVQALQDGATTILQKPLDAAKLTAAVCKAIEAEREALAEKRERTVLRSALRQLSSREFEVMDLVVRGKNSKEIGAILGIGVQTVLKHRAAVWKKLNVRNDVELALLVTARRAGRHHELAPPSVTGQAGSSDSKPPPKDGPENAPG